MNYNFVSVTLSVGEGTGIKATAATKQEGKIFAMNGTELKQEPMKGIFVKNGKKCIK